MDLKSKSGIHRLITALEEGGSFLRRMEKRARALEVLQPPENMAETASARHHPQPGPAHFSLGPPWPRRNPLGRFPRPPAPPQLWRWATAESAVIVPMVGRIAAGTPIEALQNRGQRCARAQRHDAAMAAITRWK